MLALVLVLLDDGADTHALLDLLLDDAADALNLLRHVARARRPLAAGRAGALQRPQRRQLLGAAVDLLLELARRQAGGLAAARDALVALADAGAQAAEVGAVARAPGPAAHVGGVGAAHGVAAGEADVDGVGTELCIPLRNPSGTAQLHLNLHERAKYLRIEIGQRPSGQRKRDPFGEMDDLRARHRKEAKELQAKITSKKKNASKKTRKGVNDECAVLEAELKEHQAAEIAALNGDDASAQRDVNETKLDEGLDQSGHDSTEPLADDLAKTVRFSDNTTDLSSQAEDPSQHPKKRNRQKDRLARRAAEQEAVAAQAAQEAESMPDLRKKERARLMEEFEKRSLEEKAVAANGHCMYSSIADQLHQLGLGLEPDAETNSPNEAAAGELRSNDYKIIRQAAADYISKNSDDFVPFLEEPLEGYVDKIRDTGEWGGQLELMALAKTYRININVLQAEGRVEKIEGGDRSGEREAWLAYYRHGFGLGEHYNSLRYDKTLGTT
ncbi:hypothetical protein FH972_022493 [Carpinus fangiana]|uniref:OTU domain-containing protein n=1 Tax=Carpinus fangiana TaxID=176857 RepID=A0A5N6KT28_9ROSI|nr:hypothetical protein FH972_022493 [Carpinus fangiana]